MLPDDDSIAIDTENLTKPQRCQALRQRSDIGGKGTKIDRQAVYVYKADSSLPFLERSDTFPWSAFSPRPPTDVLVAHTRPPGSQ